MDIKQMGHSWIRSCPTCGKEIIHKSRTSAYNCNKQNRNCYQCANGGRILSEEHKHNLSVSHKGQKTWNTGLTKETDIRVNQMSEKNRGRKHSKEALMKISEWTKKCWSNPEYVQKVIDGVNANRNVEAWRNTMEDRGYFTPLKEKSDVMKYYHLVWYFTNQNDLSTLEHFDKRGRANINNETYHLDHKYSIAQGYVDGMLPEVIGSLCNLEFIPCIDNIKKRHNCTISKKVLLENYYDSKKSNI